jgi:hypothetical protein
MKPKAVAMLALVAALAAGCGGAGKPRFEPAPGWHLLSGRGQLAAAKVNYTPADRRLVLTSPPSRTVGSLPRDGTVIWVLYVRGGNSHYPRRRLPLRVEQGAPSSPFEGFRCAPAVTTSRCYAASGSNWRIFGRYGRYDVDVYVFFGTDHPPPELFAQADSELARLRLPGAPTISADKPAKCQEPTGTGYYDTSLRPSSGPAGTNVVLSGRVPASSTVAAYWNLDFDHWPSLASAAPRTAAWGSPVALLGIRGVRGRCRYRLRLAIPSVRAGSYPLEVLYGDARSGASLAPVLFRVTRR